MGEGVTCPYNLYLPTLRACEECELRVFASQRLALFTCHRGGGGCKLHCEQSDVDD